jgi:hypothetical protein
MSKWVIPPADPHDVYLKRVRELESEADKRIRNQHVVSKVILKGFAAPGSRGAGGILPRLICVSARSRSPAGLVAVAGCLTFASESAEQLWKSVEDQLHNAIGTARAGNLDDQSAHAEAITDCIALHLVQSIRYLELHRSIIAKSTESVRQSAMRSKKAMLQS